MHKTNKFKTSKQQLLQLLIIFFLFIFPVVLQAGVDTVYTPVSTALNSSTYTAITTGTDPCFGFSVILSDSTAGWYLSTNAAGTGAVYISGVAGVCWDHLVLPGTTVFWAKSESATPSLYLFPGKKKSY